MKELYHICKNCEKSFFSKDMRRKYCSNECREQSVKQYFREWYQRTHPKGFCKQCRKIIFVKGRFKFCSNRCYMEYKNSDKYLKNI